MTRGLKKFEKERKVELDMKVSEDQPKSTIDDTHIVGVTLSYGANLKNKKPHEGPNFYHPKLRGRGGVGWGGRAFRRPKATKLLNSLSTKRLGFKG